MAEQSEKTNGEKERDTERAAVPKSGSLIVRVMLQNKHERRNTYAKNENMYPITHLMRSKHGSKLYRAYRSYRTQRRYCLSIFHYKILVPVHVHALRHPDGKLPQSKPLYTIDLQCFCRMYGSYRSYRTK